MNTRDHDHRNNRDDRDDQYDDRAATRTEQLLTRALRDEAADVHASPGSLQAIRRRVAAPAPSSRRWIWTAGAAGLATAATVTGIVLATDDGGGTAGAPIVDQPTGGPTASYDVWYFGAQPGNPEGPGPGDPSVFAPLYVEEHVEEATPGSTAEQAVRTFLTGTPFDPDYSTGWPSGVDVRSVSTQGDLTTFALTGTADLESRGDLTAGEAHSAIQALLRTAGATEEATFVYNGEPLSLLFGHDVSNPIEVLPDSPEDALRAPVSVDVTDGQTMTDPVTVPVTGNVFEGTVNWQLSDQAGDLVDEGFVTAGSMEWVQVQVDLGTLEPGTYVFRAYEVSMADGDEIYEDTKTLLVE